MNRKDDFYKGFDWPSMRSFQMAAPWVPEVADERDVSNFDDIYDDEPEDFVEYDGDKEWDF